MNDLDSRIKEVIRLFIEANGLNEVNLENFAGIHQIEVDID
jgi:hypothetical protein